MKKVMKGVFILIMTTMISSTTMAHSLWVSLFESFAHPPGHALVALGWGHSVPLDDLLATPSTVLQLQSFEIVDPDMKRTALPMPVIKIEKSTKTSSGLMIQKGELGISKIGLTKNTTPGTYQVAVKSKDSFFTSYIDQKGKMKMAGLPMNKIRNSKKVLMSMKYTAYAKSFMTVKKWTPPKPLGYDLEIIPTSDLSNVRAGDLVTFKVTFIEKPVSSGSDSIYYMTATSNTFGGPDGFFLSSYIMNGKAQFRIPTAGQWMTNVYIKQEVKGNSRLKNLADKCTVVYYAGTVSFTVKP